MATCIPELGKANPDHFGVSLIATDGRRFEAGDCEQPFTIQSISKPFAFGLAVEELGGDVVLNRVSVEPSGDAFNSIELQTGSNRPSRPDDQHRRDHGERAAPQEARSEHIDAALDVYFRQCSILYDYSGQWACRSRPARVRLPQHGIELPRRRAESFLRVIGRG